jgi:hypothetical protein
LLFLILIVNFFFEFRSEKNNFKKFDDEEFFDDDLDLESFFNEFHGSKFNFQGFPPSILKQFQEILEALDDDNEDRRRNFLDKYSEFRQKTDSDLDGKIYTEQLDTLFKRISPEKMLKENNLNESKGVQQVAKKLSDEEKIMAIIHGTYNEPVVAAPKSRKRQVQKAISPHFGALPPFHEFPPSFNHQQQHPNKTWGKTVISIRKPDGSYETRKVERTADGNVKTTITKVDSDGKSSTHSFSGDDKAIVPSNSQANDGGRERNLITYEGYKIPCLW